MITKYIYLLNLKYKQLLSHQGYHAYFYVMSKRFSRVHLFLQSLRLQGIKFLYVKHTRYLRASQFLKYFLGGPYIVVNFKTVQSNLIYDYNELKLVALSFNNFFINPLYFKNGAVFQTGNSFGISNFIPLFLLLIFERYVYN